MGLFGRGRIRDAVAGEARILGMGPTPKAARQSGRLDVEYRFRLEVTVPGRPPFEVEREEKVPHAKTPVLGDLVPISVSESTFHLRQCLHLPVSPHRPRRLSRHGRLLVALAGLALLWQLRPPAPALPRSLSAPLTVETIESVGLWLLWSVLGLLALALLLAPLRTRAGSTSWRLSKGVGCQNSDCSCE